MQVFVKKKIKTIFKTIKKQINTTYLSFNHFNAFPECLPAAQSFKTELIYLAI